MPKIKIILISFFVVLGVGIAGYFKAVPKPASLENAPKILIMPEKYDFGAINYGDKVQYSFLVENKGNEVLEIKRVATSCSCTTAKIEKENLAPGETAKLQVNYDSGAMGLAHGKGRQERIIFVKSSDPLTPQAEVMIYADVQ